MFTQEHETLPTRNRSSVSRSSRAAGPRRCVGADRRARPDRRLADHRAVLPNRGLAGAAASSSSTRTTALQTITNGVVNPTKVTKAGWIVAFTVGLSKLSTNRQDRAELPAPARHGLRGTPAGLAHGAQAGAKNKYTVVAQSGIYHLMPFLGQVLQEPLSLPPTLHGLHRAPGQAGRMIAPDGARPGRRCSPTTCRRPKYAYRQSRTSNCKNAAGTQTAQTTIGPRTSYLCNYTGTRVEYSATEIVNQPYPKTYVRAARPRSRRLEQAASGRVVDRLDRLICQIGARALAQQAPGFCWQNADPSPAPPWPTCPSPPPPPPVLPRSRCPRSRRPTESFRAGRWCAVAAAGAAGAGARGGAELGRCRSWWSKWCWSWTQVRRRGGRATSGP